jgi:hypothetical protein
MSNPLNDDDYDDNDQQIEDLKAALRDMWALAERLAGGEEYRKKLVDAYAAQHNLKEPDQ